MATTFKIREFTALTRQLETIKAELPKGASVSHVIALLHIFDICGDSGIKAKDIEILTGESAPTVSRMLKAFNETYNLISQKQFSLIGPKLIFLTDKGEALKQRVFLAKEDYNQLAQVQQGIVDENIRAGIERRKAAKRRDIQRQYKEQGREPDGLLSASLLRKLDREKLLKNLGNLHGEQLFRRIKELKAGQSQYVFDQINRAKRNALRGGYTAFVWRGQPIEIFDPEYGYSMRDELTRVLTRRHIWFYYNKGDDPELSLPVGIQRDFSVEEFEKFMSQQISDFNAEMVIGLGDVTFSGRMDTLREMLNATQYRKARDLATRSVADIANSAEKAKIISDKAIEETQQQSDALHAFASDPNISKDEQAQFRYDAYGADRRLAQEKAHNASLEQSIKEQQEQIDKLTKMMGKLLEDKDD